MRAIYKKEIHGFFHSMIGWLFFGVSFFFMGWNFRYYGLNEGYPYISYIISAGLFIFLFCFPLLTMRLFSEEKRQHTDQMLFTSTVPVYRIVLGKYLAVLTVFAGDILFLAICPMILRIYGQVPMAENIVALLGFFLFGMVCLAIGEWISALTENQIVSAVLTFFLLLFGVMAEGICDMIAPNGNLLTTVISVFDLTASFDYALYGMLYWPGILYYISLTALFLYLTTLALTKGRFHVAGDRGVLAVLSHGLVTALIICAVVGVNLALRYLPEEKTRVDLTYNQIHSITEETRNYLSSLTQDVNIYVLADADTRDDTVYATLRDMESVTDRLTVQYVSPETNPYFYMAYTDTAPDTNSMIVVSGAKSRVIDYYDCYQVQYDYAYNEATAKYEATDYRISGYDGEGRIVAGIAYVLSEENTKFYVISGHDEVELDEELLARMENANYDLATINLLTYDEIPEDGDCVMVLGPLTDLNEADAAKIKAFLDKGKSGIFVVAYTDKEELENYYSIFADYGIIVMPGLVCEDDGAYYNSQKHFLLPEIVDTDVTEPIYTTFRTKYVYMPFSKGMILDEAPDVTCQTFLRSTEKSYTVNDTGAQEPEILAKGPFSLALTATRYYPEGTGKIAVFGSDYMLYSDVNLAVNGNNYNLFWRALQAVTDTDDISAIPVKSYTYDRVMMSESARTVFTILMTALIPLLFLVSGVVIWWKRRKY